MRRSSAAGAAMAVRPGDRTDEAALEKLIASEWRLERPFFFQHLARSLGTIGGDAARTFLAERRVWEAVQGGDDEGRRQLALDVGLVLAGDVAAGDRIFTAVAAQPMNAWAVHRWAHGSASRSPAGGEAGPALTLLWDRVGDPRRACRSRRRCCWPTPRRPTTSRSTRVGADALQGHPTRVARAVAHAWALRRGRPGARAARRRRARRGAQPRRGPAGGLRRRRHRGVFRGPPRARPAGADARAPRPR